MPNYEAIYEEAWEAGHDAAAAALKAKIDQHGSDIDNYNCGYAWVTVHPARGPFITFCKKNHLGSKDIRPGWMFWCSWYQSQDISVHKACAKAFCSVLTKHGINAHWHSRLD